MFQTIDEKVSVIGLYKSGVFFPKKIQWGERVLLVREITLVSDIKEGQVKKRMYSLLCGKELYRLVFNRETEIWVLQEIWVEG